MRNADEKAAVTKIELDLNIEELEEIIAPSGVIIGGPGGTHPAMRP